MNKAKNYSWKAIDPKGNHVQGEKIVLHPVLLKSQLYRQGLKQIKIRRKYSLHFLTQKITYQDTTSFSRDLATLLTAGVPLLQSLELIANGHPKPAMKDLVISIKNSIENGNSITTALDKFSHYFNHLYRSLISIGEKTGSLDTILNRIATYQENMLKLKNKIKKALLYPVTVIIVAISVTIALLILVVPQFETLFASAGAQLPLLTRIVIVFSKMLQQYSWALITMPFLLVYGINLWRKKSSIGLQFVDKLFLKIPLLGDTLKNAIIARLVRTLATTLAAGLSIIDALQATEGIANNVIFKHAISTVKQSITNGEMLHKALRKTQLFPSIVIQMIAVGEESGTLVDMLNRLAVIFEDKVDTTVANLSNLLEPCIMIVLGTVIGGLVIAMYLPIFKLGNVI